MGQLAVSMGSLVTQQVGRPSRGAVAAAATAGSVAPVVLSPVLGVTAWPAPRMGWDWLSFRIKNGLRF
jgi:hypothetical protein